MKKEAFDRELKIISDISKEFGAKKVVLFGSCLDDVESARDIDIAVSGIKPREFFKYCGRVSMAVDDEIDIIDLDEVREHLCKRVLSKGQVVYEEGV